MYYLPSPSSFILYKYRFSFKNISFAMEFPEINEPLEFPWLNHPFSLMVSGPTKVGKTKFVKRILDTKLIKPFPSRIVWCYGAYQALFHEMSNVEFHEGLPKNLHNLSNAVLIIDDLMDEVGDDKRLSKLFTKRSHHRNISVILIVQNLFHKGKQMRNVSLNTSYLCCFKNVRDKQQIACLARQMYPKQTKFFMESFNDATLEPHGYLFLDLEPETIEELRVRSNIFPDDLSVVYVPR